MNARALQQILQAVSLRIGPLEGLPQVNDLAMRDGISDFRRLKGWLLS